MVNPFEIIEERLSSIEMLILDLKHQPKKTGSEEKKERLLTVQETAEFLNLSVTTIYSKVSKGELPVMKQGKRLYFSSIELRDYLEAGRKQTEAEIGMKAEALLSNIEKGLNHGE